MISSSHSLGVMQAAMRLGYTALFEDLRKEFINRTEVLSQDPSIRDRYKGDDKVGIVCWELLNLVVFNSKMVMCKPT
jgi:hypothetical protein